MSDLRALPLHTPLVPGRAYAIGMRWPVSAVQWGSEEIRDRLRYLKGLLGENADKQWFEVAELNGFKATAWGGTIRPTTRGPTTTHVVFEALAMGCEYAQVFECADLNYGITGTLLELRETTEHASDSANDFAEAVAVGNAKLKAALTHAARYWPIYVGVSLAVAALVVALMVWRKK